MVIWGGREQGASVGNPGMGREQGERERSWARRSKMEMGKFVGAGFEGGNRETGRKGERGAEDDRREMELEDRWRKDGTTVLRRRWRRREGDRRRGAAAAAVAAAATATYLWLGQGVAVVAAARMRATAAAAAVGRLTQPFVSSHSRGRRLLFLFSNDG